LLEQFRGREEVVVLGLLLSGAPVAREVADHLGAPLDFVIIRRLLAPRGPGSLVCAVSVAGSLVLDEEVMPPPAEPKTPLDYFVSDALAELAGRERACRGGRPPLDLARKTIIAVDCGIRSGSTMRSAIKALRRKEPARIIAAVPVASLEGRAEISALADEVICLGSPEPFGNVAMWYKDFTRPGDDRVSELLD
jgi:putative phosphoribosyl transferase